MPDNESRSSRNAIEWVALTLGVQILLGLLGILTMEAIQPPRPPRFEVRKGSPYASEGGWLLPVRVTNVGSHGLAAVEVRGTLGDDEASATIEHLPSGASESLVLGFEKEPSRARVFVSGAERP